VTVPDRDSAPRETSARSGEEDVLAALERAREAWMRHEPRRGPDILGAASAAKYLESRSGDRGDLRLNPRHWQEATERADDPADGTMPGTGGA